MIIRNIDLAYLFPQDEVENLRLKAKIREKQNSRTKFTTSLSNDNISNAVIKIKGGLKSLFYQPVRHLADGSSGYILRHLLLSLNESYS